MDRLLSLLIKSECAQTRDANAARSPWLAAGPDPTAGARDPDHQSGHSLDLGRPGGAARSGEPPPGSADDQVDAIREPGLRNGILDPARLGVPVAPLLVEQPCLWLGDLDDPRPPHEQSADFSSGDGDRPRVFPLAEGG